MTRDKHTKVRSLPDSERIRYWYLNNKDSFRFITLFFLFSILFFLPYFIFQQHLRSILLLTAYSSGLIANSIGLPVVISGVFLDIGPMNLEIIHECTGIFAIVVSVSSILAYPATLKNKTKGLVVIIPFILLLNLFRILFLIYIGKYHMGLFSFIHAYLWQGTFIIFIILAWFLWIELVVNHAG